MRLLQMAIKGVLIYIFHLIHYFYTSGHLLMSYCFLKPLQCITFTYKYLIFQ